MRLVLSAAVFSITAGIADAAVIRYSAEGPAQVSYAIRYIGGSLDSIDVQDEYAPRVIGGPKFDIDTSAFKGRYFQYSSNLEADKVPLPAGVSNIGRDSFYEYSVEFDDDWNIVSLASWFDNGAGGESWFMNLDSIYLRHDTGARRQILDPATGKYTNAIDFYGYASEGVELTVAPIPLPSSMLLLLTAIGAAAFLRRRRV